MMRKSERAVAAAAQAPLMRRIRCWNVYEPTMGSVVSRRSASSLGSGQVLLETILCIGEDGKQKQAGSEKGYGPTEESSVLRT
jgi:hypothetical protein